MGKSCYVIAGADSRFVLRPTPTVSRTFGAILSLKTGAAGKDSQASKTRWLPLVNPREYHMLCFKSRVSGGGLDRFHSPTELGDGIVSLPTPHTLILGVFSYLHTAPSPPDAAQ